ncbi:MAG: ribonuclease III [Francisellaceae bacterium]
MNTELEPLYRHIGYHFKNPKHIERALTHRSHSKEHNERLEFLGDSILGFVIAEALYHQFPHQPEGILSLLRMSLVRGKTLTDMATRFKLGDYMRFGIGELKSGGHTRSRLLEDAFEAMIGAIYLDSDLETIKALILQWYCDKLKHIDIERDTKDPKSRLQEYLQKEIQQRPDYQVLNVEGDNHNQLFTVAVSLGDKNKTYEGTGKSIKSAEQAAAKAALKAIGQDS